MALVISDKELNDLNFNEREFKIEIAVLFYEKGKFTIGQASKFANLTQLDFQEELSKRDIHLNYTLAELKTDLDTIQFLKKK